MKKRKFRIPIVWFIIFTALFVFVFTATLILTQNALIYNTVNSVLGGERRVLKSGDPSQYMYYDGDYSDKESVLDAANALNERIVEEGAVLLKNEDGTLPLHAIPFCANICWAAIRVRADLIRPIWATYLRAFPWAKRRSRIRKPLPTATRSITMRR